MCCVLVCFNIQRIIVLFFLIQYIYVVFQELNMIHGIKRVPSQEGVFSRLMMHGVILCEGIEITVSSREDPHLLREKQLHQRQQQEISFMSLIKTKYIHCNTHSSIQVDYTNPISLLHRLTLSAFPNRWRTICFME